MLKKENKDTIEKININLKENNQLSEKLKIFELNIEKIDR
jgi:hypothetical protein